MAPTHPSAPPGTYVYNLGFLFERVAATHGSRRALRSRDGSAVSYADLAAESARCARWLLSQGIARGSVVAILADKSPRIYAWMLGCLRIGAAYTILDPGSPGARAEKMLTTAQPSLLLHDRTSEVLAVAQRLGIATVGVQVDVASLSPAPLAETADVLGSDVAYVMFTSGSTGTPKGAAMSHQNLLNFRRWAADQFSITPDDVLTGANPLHFDNSVFDTYASLLNGAGLALFGTDDVRDAAKLASLVDAAGCTVWFSVPSLLIYLTTTKAVTTNSFRSTRAIVFGGEGYPKSELAKLWSLLGSRVAFWNVYGPTECTCICSAYRITDADVAERTALAPLGKLAPNFSYVLLNDENVAVKPGDAGELCLLGPQVGLGYFNDAERTAASFQPNPLRPQVTERMYRTGDLAREDAAGLLHFVGRKDNQIKHMGYRIELEEIEAALHRLGYVVQAAAVYLRPRPGFGTIVAAIAADRAVTEVEVISGLKELLPPYMIPGRVAVMAALPKNANGKIDRKAVAALVAET